MADCSASGTAIDRVIQSAVASTLNQGNNGAATSSAAAAASRAMGNFFGATAATASSGPMGMGAMEGASSSVMPMAPLESLGGGAMMRQMPSSAAMHQQQGMMESASRMDEAWAASNTGAQHAAAPMNNHMMHNQHTQQMHHQMPMQQMHAPPQQMMMMQQQQQQQMMMMQQVQMQQYQMTAMVQYQQQQRMQQQQQQQQQVMKNQAQKQSASINTTTGTSSTIYETTVDDDVATVSEEEQLHHEGLTEDASIERLAQAWRDAEAEYAEEEFGDDEYDVSDMGGLYSEGYAEATATDTAQSTTNNNGDSTTEPQYEFSEASRMYGCLSTPSTDIAPQNLNFPENLYEKGLQHFDEGAIAEAILCFESTLRNIDPEHADAWRMLGKCHTENDEDAKAISCWHRSLERDPFSPETLLALGVAYVNELDHENAVETLRNWVGNHPLYAGMATDNENNLDLEGEEDMYGSATEEDHLGASTASPRMRAKTMASMRDVERLLLRALEYDRTADAAADVYEALGVVYNVSRDYDAAVDAFRKAIDVRPTDYQLRNKLGATLANSNRSEEALPNYKVALKLKPKYARGWLNMAISHSNMHNYSEAARCYLQTLSLNPEANHVWSYLRIALTCDEKWDLLPLAASRDLVGFRDHFDFVEY